jgi:pimeloyl-ACP methyl ester carboxylesterase
MLKEADGDLTEVRPGRTLYYRVVPIGTGKPVFQVLLIHGTCASSAQYDLLLSHLVKLSKESIVCHLYDAVSCGESPLVKDWDAYRTDEAVLDLKAIMEAKLDSSLPILLVAHSYAPTVIIRCIHRHGVPENLKGCLFLCPGTRSELNPNRDGGHPIFFLPVFVLRCLQPTLTKSFTHNAYHPKTDLELIRDAVSENNANNMYAAKGYHTNHLWATREECGALHDVPTIILHGMDDRIIPLEAGENMADLVKAKKFIKLQNSRHQVMEEQPQEVATYIVEFINELLKRTQN